MDLKELMKESGIVGDGGAGFPSYAKLAEGADTLVVNGCECEPLLYTDYTILKRELSMVLHGIRAVMEYCKLTRALLSVKEHTAKRLGFTDGQKLTDGVFARVLANSYPAGDEITLIYESTGRLIRPGNLPLTKGVIVYNVETMYNLARAMKYGESVTTKWLTVGGDIAKPVVLRVPIGTLISDIFERLGITVDEKHAVIEGGPSMGRIINHETAEVCKTTKAILILPKDTRAVESKLINERAAVKRAETACCQCTRCTDMCPRYLLGYPLEPHKMVRTAMGVADVTPDLVLTATLCCSCGICENLACSQGISPRAVINNYKALLGKNKMKFIGKDEVFARFEREYRKIPSDKWAATLGVAKFDRVAEYIGEINDFDRVELPLGRFIGAPSMPVVRDGEEVAIGQIVAVARDGLSVSLAASINGRVTVSDTEIRIDRV